MDKGGYNDFNWQGVDLEDLQEAISAATLGRALKIDEDKNLVAYIGNQYINLEQFGETIVNREWNEYLLSILEGNEEDRNVYDKIMSQLISLFVADQEIFKDRRMTSLKASLQIENKIKNIKEKLKKDVVVYSQDQVLEAIMTFSDIKGFQNAGDDKIPEIFGKEAYEEYRAKFSEEIHRYLLKLVKEGIITEELVSKSGAFKYIEPEELLQLHEEGLLTTKMLAESPKLHSVGNGLFGILIASGFFDTISAKELMMLHKNGFFSVENIVKLYKDDIIYREDVIEILGGAQEVYSQYEAATRNKNKRRAELYYSLFGRDDICKLYLNGKADLSATEKCGIDKEFIEELPESDFLKFAQRGFPKTVSFESDELINGYISKYSGKAIVELAQNGYIEPEKLIGIVDKDVKIEEKEKAITVQDLIGLYTPSLVTNLLAKGKIDKDFINSLDEKVLLNLDETERLEYIQKIIDGCKITMKESEYATTMISLIENTNLPKEVFENLGISENTLMDMYIEETLSEEQAIEYFNKAILDEKAIKIIYGEDYNTVIKLVKNGKLAERAFAILPQEVLMEKLMFGNLRAEDIFKIYATYETVSASELSEMFEQYGNSIDKRVHIVNLISEGFDVNKIKELYLYDILTHSDLLELQESGIITEEECEEISKMDIAKFYKEIFDQDKRIENIYEESEMAEEEKDKLERDMDDELPEIPKVPEVPAGSRKEFFKSLGAYAYQDIESFDSEGREAPFSNYKMLGFLDYGLAIFENFEQTRNATYVMTFQELKSYIIKEAERSIVFKKSKQALREEIANGRAVRVCNHTVNWGNNIIEAMKSLSKDARENISAVQQQELASKIQEQYRLAKERQMEDERAVFEVAKAKQAEVMGLEMKTKEEYDKERGTEYGE